MATARGVAWIPRMLTAGSPGIRWTMKNTMNVTPKATGISCSSLRPTNAIRPTSGRLPVLSCRCLLAQPDVLQVVVAERGDVEAVHAGRGGVGVRRVVEEGHERVGRRLGLDGVVERLPGGGGEGLLRHVGVLDHGRVVVRGEEGLGTGRRVHGEGGQL